MKRRQLVEIEDTTWCPAAVRDGATDYLQFVVEKLQPYRRIAGPLGAAIDRCGATRIVDLCSGAGGPWLSLLPVLNAGRAVPLRVTLTDRYPNLSAWRHAREQSNGLIDFEPEPVDARDVPSHLRGFRTLFTGFHHFEPEAARRVLRGAAEAGDGIGVFELTSRSLVPMIGMLFVPLVIALTTPAIRPFRWSRLLWTYLLPAIPLVGLFDGVVSCFRSYSPRELSALTAGVSKYAWDIGQRRVPVIANPVTYVIGTPR